MLQAITLLHIIGHLLVSCLDVGEPHLSIEIDTLLQLFAPLWHIVYRGGLVCTLGFEHRKGEVQVGVCPVGSHATAGTGLAGSILSGMFTQQMASQRQCQRHSTRSLLTSNHQRMRHTSFVHHLEQMLLGLLLAYDIRICYFVHPCVVILLVEGSFFNISVGLSELCCPQR